MSTRRLAVLIGGLVIAALPGGLAAQESPDAITRAEWKCQNAFGRALARFAGGTAQCLAECKSSPGRRCLVYFPDAITGDCLSRANASAKSIVLRNCSGSDCPECYDGGQSCDAYADQVLSNTAPQVEFAIDSIYCDDSYSPDGLTRAEQRCQGKLTAASGRFAKAMQECFAGCQERVRDGATGPSSCEGAFLDTPTFDPRTQRCIDRARDRLLGTCEDACGAKGDSPDCFYFDCPSATAILTSQVVGQEPDVYCQDIPQICGDGRITGDEACDPTAAPTGCAPDADCVDCFYCYPRCGNGTIDPGEVCDPYAYPPSCPDGRVCTLDCDACVVAPAGFCVPTSPDTCNAGFHGCDEPCDNGTPGSACVSSVGGAFACVQTVCTLRTCDTSAECFPGEVCFTEGCCGEPVPGTTAGARIGASMGRVW